MSNKDKILRLWNEIKKRYETYPVKDEADFDTVLSDWTEILGEYEESELQYALKQHIRETKSSSYPKIAHIEKYLDINNKKEILVIKPKSEVEIWYEKHVVDRVKNEMPIDYLYPVYKHACNELIKNSVDDTKGYCNSFAEGLKLAYSNGYLDGFEEFIHNYAKSNDNIKISNMSVGAFNIKKAVRNIFK